MSNVTKHALGQIEVNGETLDIVGVAQYSAYSDKTEIVALCHAGNETFRRGVEVNSLWSKADIERMKTILGAWLIDDIGKNYETKGED